MIPLPPEFVQRMQHQLGDEGDAFFAAMQKPHVRGIRLNPLKSFHCANEPCVQGLGSAVPWSQSGRYLSAQSLAGSHPLHACGAYYLQEPSAMLPAGILKPSPGETVLDLCAAPGGKSTQIASMMQGQGTLVCNEPVASRAEILSGNLERMGVLNAVVVCADPSQLAKRWPQLFDAILVDAPCSGEGMFRKHPESRLEWNADSPAHCAKRQLRILESAAGMLKPGGRLCYSTCTFSEEENESVIRTFLHQHPEFRAGVFSVPIGSQRVMHSQNGAIRLYPHIVQAEGHFAALLEKADTNLIKSAVTMLPAQQVFTTPDSQTMQAFTACWHTLASVLPPVPNAMIGNLLVSAPSLPPLHGIKTYRAGLALGRCKGRVFIPDHALALAGPPLPIRDIPLNDADIANYFRGEVLPAGPVPHGFWVVSYAGLPAGFVKHSDQQLKNHYPKGLRKR